MLGPLGEELGQQLECPVKPCAATSMRNLGRLVLLREFATDADAESQPVAGQQLQGGDLLGRPGQRTHTEQHHAEAELDVGGHGGGYAEAGRGIEYRRRALEVIAGPHGVEPDPLGQPRRLGHGQPLTTPQRVERRQQHTPTRHLGRS